jgi:hypothetical protein
MYRETLRVPQYLPVPDGLLRRSWGSPQLELPGAGQTGFSQRYSMPEGLHLRLSGYSGAVGNGDFDDAKAGPRCAQQKIEVTPRIVIPEKRSSAPNRVPVSSKERFGAAKCVGNACAEHP